MNGRVYECEGCGRTGAVDPHLPHYECPRCRWIGRLEGMSRARIRQVIAKQPWAIAEKRRRVKTMTTHRAEEALERRLRERREERERMREAAERNRAFLTRLHEVGVGRPAEWWNEPLSDADLRELVSP